MSYISTAGIPTAFTAPAATQPPAANAPAPRAFTQSVSHAVKRLNEASFAGEGREVVFSFDRATRLPVVKVVDANTGELISQLPAESALNLAANTENLLTEIQDESVF